MKFKTIYDDSVDEGISFENAPSMAKQQFQDECDINKIMSRYEKTGLINHITDKPMYYSDVSGLGAYQDALQIVLDAEGLFGQLSATVRDRFGNDPAKFVEFCENPANAEEMIKLGLASPKQVPDTVPTNDVITP